MKIKLIDTSDDGVMWFDVDGVTYGITPDSRLLDESGAPYPDGSNSEILEELCKH